MIVNAKKHKALIIGQTDLKFSFPVKCELDIFGMTIDNTLNFGSHISTVCYGSAISSLRTHMLKLYKAFILPHFYYCSSV